MDYMTWCVVVCMRLYVTYAPVDVANIGPGMQILTSSNGYFMTSYQALEDVQLSQGFTLCGSSLVMKNCCV